MSLKYYLRAIQKRRLGIIVALCHFSFRKETLPAFYAFIQMLRQILYILFVSVSMLSCEGNGYEHFVARMDSLSQQDPQATVDSIDHWLARHRHLSKRGRMTIALCRLRAQNSADIPFTSDSVAREVVGYFDSHGSLSQQVSAYYVLGSVYRDLGEDPRALAMYQKAVSLNKANDNSIDYKLIYKIYGQQGEILYRQLAFEEAVNTYKKAEQVALANKDTLYALFAKEQVCPILVNQGRVNESLYLRNQLYVKYKKLGYNDFAIKCLLPNADLLITRKRLNEAFKILNDYQVNSGVVDCDDNVARGYESYYIIKGNYYLAKKRYAKASYYYRKSISASRNYSIREQSFKGYCKMYKQLNNVDSVAKYAELAMVANDSLFINMSNEEMQKLQAAYNYKSKELSEQQAKSKLKYTIFVFTIIVFSLIILILICAYSIHRRKSKEKMEWLERRKRMDEIVIENRTKGQEIEMLNNVKAELRILIDNQSSEISALINEKKKLVADLQRKSISEGISLGADGMMASSDDDSCNGIVDRFKQLANVEYKSASSKDWSKMDRFVVVYHYPIYLMQKQLSNVEYNIAVLVRLNFRPSEICILTSLSMSNVSNIRKRLYEKLTGKKGSSKDFDEYIKNVDL